VVEALPPGGEGRILLDIDPAVAVHAIVRQSGLAGQDEAVDQLLELIERLKSHGRNPAELPGRFWSQTSHELLLSHILLEHAGVETVIRRFSQAAAETLG